MWFGNVNTSIYALKVTLENWEEKLMLQTLTSMWCCFLEDLDATWKAGQLTLQGGAHTSLKPQRCQHKAERDNDVSKYVLSFKSKVRISKFNETIKD